MDAWTFDSIELDRMWRCTHPCLHGGVDNARMGVESGRGCYCYGLLYTQHSMQYANGWQKVLVRRTRQLKFALRLWFQTIF